MFLDPIGRWVATTTGRTLDQHAADPFPAAAELPHAANTLRRDRSELLLAVDELRTLLINADDLAATPADITHRFTEIARLADNCRDSRQHVEALIADRERHRYADANPAPEVRRRYVNPGDTVMVVLPHTDANRRAQVAGRRVQLRVNNFDAELGTAVTDGPARLSCADAGIYNDPTDPQPGVYVLQVASRTAPRR